jgi:serine/threonine protein kinase
MPAPHTGPLPGTIGEYQIAGKIGSGGMATVYRAHDPDNRVQVAIKVLAVHLEDDENSRKRFEREANTLIHLNHPHILPVYAYGEDGGTPYLVMRLLSGRSLADLLKDGPLPVEQIGRFTRQIAGALDYAHARHVIHRDVKPGNVLLDDQDNPYLADFGAVYFIDAGPGARLTSDGRFVGTAAYASPEQCEGRELGRPADIYSLAVMVFQMATGRLPFEAPSSLMVIKKQLYEPPPNPLAFNPDLPIQLYHVLAKALAKDPSARYPSAMKFSEAVDEALGLHALAEADGDDDWLRGDIQPFTPDIPARPSAPDPRSGSPEPPEAEPEVATGFRPDIELYGGPEDPFAGIALEEPVEFDDRFDLDFEESLDAPGGDFPPVDAVLEPVLPPEPEVPPATRAAIHAIGTPPPVTPRRRAPRWIRISIYATIAISLAAIIAAAIIAYSEFHTASPRLDATTTSAALGVRLDYPAAWHIATADLAVLSADSAPAITLSDQPVAPGGPYDPATLVMAVQRIDAATVFHIPARCLDRIASGPQDTFACMEGQHYATPVYQRFNTPRYRGVRLPGTLPPARASLPVILLPTGGPRWIAVVIVHWNGYDDAYQLQEQVARSVRIAD